MTPGEPLEKTKDAESERNDATLPGPLTHGRSRDNETMLSDTAANLLSQTLDDGGQDDDAAHAQDMALLDEEVRSLLNTIAQEETEHDEAWVEVSRREESTADDMPAASEPAAHAASAVDRDALTGPVEPAKATPDEHGTAGADAIASTAAHDGIDGIPPEGPGEDTDPSRVEDTVAQADTTSEATVPEAPGLQAIDALSERFDAAETRNGEALDRIGHALSMIATRIDGLESRATDRTIADVAFVAAPPEDDEDDGSVAPYIARAEKELKAKKESGSMDIFDRIARAAENKFDDETGSGEARIVENASDGRRVGTKRWQPSKAVKKRMELLEKARAENSGEEEAATGQPAPAPAPASRKLRVENEDVSAGRETQVEEREAPLLEPEIESGFTSGDEDDAGLSVLPGARGRRRNRARKSALDSDFEDVFAEEGDKPSIRSLRRKMRERPVEQPEAETKSMGGMLGGILGKKSAKKEPVEPVIGEDRDEDDLMAAFDAADDAPAIDAPESPAKPARSGKIAKATAGEHEDDDDDDLDDEEWDDEDASGSRRKPLIYALIAVAAGAGFAVWKSFIA